MKKNILICTVRSLSWQGCLTSWLNTDHCHSLTLTLLWVSLLQDPSWTFSLLTVSWSTNSETDVVQKSELTSSYQEVSDQSDGSFSLFSTIKLPYVFSGVDQCFFYQNCLVASWWTCILKELMFWALPRLSSIILLQIMTHHFYTRFSIPLFRLGMEHHMDCWETTRR